MGLLITNADFVGKFALTTNQATEAKIDLFIADYEERYLIDLLGKTLFDLFKTDYLLGPPPPNVIYNNIFQPFAFDENSEIKTSEGMKKMVTGFIFFEYARRQPYTNTTAGFVKQKIELGEVVSFEESDIYGRYNESIVTYEAIQWYIKKNKTDLVYQDYNGQCKRIASPY